MMTAKKAFLIAAPTSGSGKTTIARGLMTLFTKKGYKVQAFKEEQYDKLADHVRQYVDMQRIYKILTHE